jgi:hypothetical protein
MRAMMLAKTFAFASTYKLIVKTEMNKAIVGPEEFKAIIEKKSFPDILDSPESRQSFKEFL